MMRGGSPSPAGKEAGWGLTLSRLEFAPRPNSLSAIRPMLRDSAAISNPNRQTSGGMRQLAVRTGVVHRGGKQLRQNLGYLIDRHVEPRGQLLDGVAAEHLMQLVGRNRQIRTVSDPGFDLLGEAPLLQLCNDGRETALIAIAQDFAQHHRQHSAPKLTEGVP